MPSESKNFSMKTAFMFTAFAITAITMVSFSQAHAADPVKVTPETYIRAESDRTFHNTTKLAGGVNRFFHFRAVTPLDNQTVVRMNRDTLYSGAVVDTSKGATITVPKMPAGRYCSVLMVDNDHYCPGVIYDAGTHKLPEDTKYLALVVRIQLLKPTDPEDVALVNKLQDQFVIKAESADPFPEPKWDAASLEKLTAAYKVEFDKYELYPDGFMAARGKADEKLRHLAAAGAWGLFPNEHAVYINYNGKLPAKGHHTATYKVPENNAFWSITVYGADGYMKSDNSALNEFNTKMNEDGTFTVHFGSREDCGDVPNRLDVSEGWNFLMRVYRPGLSVLDGSYKLPDAEPTGGSNDKSAAFASPADFGVTDYAYKVSETDFNIKRSLAKAPINEWAHQNDVSYVKTQQVIRENQDVVYSSAVVDISQGATLSLPKSETYHIIQIIDMQNYEVDVVYPGQSITVKPDNVTFGNYVYLNMRIRKLPDDKGGTEATLKLQRMAKIEANSAVDYKTPDCVVDMDTLLKIRAAMIEDVKRGKLKDASVAAGTPYTTDPQFHLYATAYGWGGLSIEHAAYQVIRNETQIENGKTLSSSVTFTPPKIDYDRGGFWSLTTYDEEGWLARDNAAISNSEAVPNDDGSYTIRFNSPGKPNNVDTPTPFTVLLRVYVPKSKAEIIPYMNRAGKELIIK